MRTEKEISEILHSLDGMGRAAAPPYLYTRVRGRMQQEAGFWATASNFIARPAIAIACVAAVIGANVWAALPAGNITATPTETTAEDSYAAAINNNNYSLATLEE